VTYRCIIPAGDGSVLWGVPDVGRWVREVAGAAEGHRQEATQRAPEDCLAHHTCSQTSAGPPRPDQKVCWLLGFLCCMVSW